MNILRRLANSAFVRERFRWPSSRTIRIYWWIVAAIAVVTSMQATGDVYRHGVSKGLAHPGQIALIAAGANLLAWGLLGLIFLFMWGMYYRMGTDILAGFRRFRAWLPGAFQSAGRAAAAVILFFRRIPSFIGGFFRGLGRAFQWLGGRPAWWRSLNKKQKTIVLTQSLFLSLYAGVLALFYPVASHLSAASPKWMILSDTPWFQRLFYDFFLGSLIFVVLMMVVATAIDFAIHLFKKR